MLVTVISQSHTVVLSSADGVVGAQGREGDLREETGRNVLSAGDLWQGKDQGSGWCLLPIVGIAQQTILLCCS